jgi:ubiquitin-small subunit ribosomal protein S27Ae
MAAPKGGVKGDKTGKKPHRNKPTGKKYNHYKIEGDKVTRGKSCPRCGPGVFLANHKNRWCCGKCKYTEFADSSEKKE